MRDETHMKKTLDAILERWKEFPELRLGQLLVYANPKSSDIFYVEDGKWEFMLREFKDNFDEESVGR